MLRYGMPVMSVSADFIILKLGNCYYWAAHEPIKVTRAQ